MFWTDLHHYGPSLRLIVPYGAAWVPISLKSVFLGTPCNTQYTIASSQIENIAQIIRFLKAKGQIVYQMQYFFAELQNVNFFQKLNILLI